MSTGSTMPVPPPVEVIEASAVVTLRLSLVACPAASTDNVSVPERLKLMVSPPVASEIVAEVAPVAV